MKIKETKKCGYKGPKGPCNNKSVPGKARCIKHLHGQDNKRGKNLKINR